MQGKHASEYARILDWKAMLLNPGSVEVCMKVHVGRTTLLLASVVTVAAGAISARPAPPTATKSGIGNAGTLAKSAVKILQENCVACHTGASASGKLDLSTRAAFLRGGVSGPSFNKAKPETSLLVRAMRHDGRSMPPSSKVSTADTDTIAKWMAAGSPWADTGFVVKSGPPQVDDYARNWWSFKPVRQVALPAVKDAKWGKLPIDRIVLAKLEKNGLKPNAPLNRVQLLRRVTYDLIGLPPSKAEVEAFIADKSPSAYSKVVDRLLASPQYGERWGRHWLDLVRYAETNSFERDGDKPDVWRYRDYVIKSFNEDKPYDRFVKEQLAGDELQDAGTDGLIATGYYRLGQWDDEPVDPEQARFDELDDIVTTTGQSVLGLNVNCARCHDSKVDPLPQRDYYRMVAFFNNINRYGLRSHESVMERSLRPIASKEIVAKYQADLRTHRDKLQKLDRTIRGIEQKAQKTFIPVEHQEFRDEFKRPGLLKLRVPNVISQAEYDDYIRLLKERQETRDNPPPGLESALCVTEPGAKPKETFVLARGSAAAPTEKVEPGFPSVLVALDAPVELNPDGSPTSGLRSQFADWITQPSNPLTSRVIVNRVFQHHFGRGIVRTTSNFGYTGTKPTHPELLDYLAGRFVAGGWKFKALHKEILLSNTYQMSSAPNPAALKKDPENELLWRVDMQRLEAEVIRDSILSASGQLNLNLGGPSVLVRIPDEVLAGQSVPGAGWGLSSPEDQARRSVYVKIKRSLVVPFFAAFDAADTDTACPVRNTTVVPTQALSLLNSQFIQEQAGVFAKSVADKHSEPAEQVTEVLWRVLQRKPSTAEVTRGTGFMAKAMSTNGQNRLDALKQYCMVALNLNEFIYID
jgi:mono/diheme cytochrome c family protein